MTPTPAVDDGAWPAHLDPSDCPVCGSDHCEDPEHMPPTDDPTTEAHAHKSNAVGKPNGKPGRCSHVLDAQAVCSLCGLAFGLDAEGLTDAALVAAEGRNIAAAGIPWIVEGMVPGYGMLGMLVAYAKVGKTTFGQAVCEAVSRGAEIIGRKTSKTRGLYVAAEDPREYTAYVARHLRPEPEAMTFYRKPVILNDEGLDRIAWTVKAGGYGFVVIASWQAVVRGLLKDENDNAGAVAAVERVKAATRETKIPWLIDAHSGRGEDQADDADPVKALRGASGAAGAADYILSLRYSDGTFGTKRRLSGRGRFVNLAPQTITYDLESGTYEDLGSTKDAGKETTWRLIAETEAVCAEPRSADTIARTAGLTETNAKVSGQTRKRIHDALHNREGVTRTEGTYHGRRTVLYALNAEETR